MASSPDTNLRFTRSMKLLIADDHILLREGIRLLLEDISPQTDIDVIEVGTFNEAVAAAKHHPDLALILLDLRMPGAEGVGGVQVIHRISPDVPILVVSASEEPWQVQRALDQGARGYVSKASGSDVMLQGIRTVLAGGRFVDPRLRPDARPAAPAEDSALARLTPRQVDVLSMLRKGKSNKEIGRELNLAEITVKMHVTAILKTLGVQNRTQAAIVAEQLGL